VVTTLFNGVMPLIRYRTGDVVCPGNYGEQPCACGLPFPRIENVQGRTFDLVRGRSGEMVTGTFWTLLLRSRPGVEQFQVFQPDYEQLEIRLVVNPEYERPTTEKYFRGRIAEQFVEAPLVDFSYPGKIHPLKSGKHRFVISEVGKGHE